jgi:hypothetical protein
MWIWTLLFLLGAYHGLNPAMGWLFAVALGLQEKTGRAVVLSLLPLGLGHLASVAMVIAVAQMARVAMPLHSVRLATAGVLIAFGLYRLFRKRHPRWVGMRVGSRDLALWSFLMASAHGAGLMLLPFVVASQLQPMPATHHHAMLMSSLPEGGVTPEWWLPIGLHTAGYLIVSALVALVVYYKFGVAVLRRAWFNLDYIWIGSLIAMGIITLLV